MKRASLIVLAMLLMAGIVYAQGTPAPASPQTPPPAAKSPAPSAAPSATAPATKPAAGVPAGVSKIAVIDFARALTETADGKKANQQFTAEVTKRQNDLQEKVKKGQELQSKLNTQGSALSDTVKADTEKQIEALQTEVTRMQEDAQRDLGELQQKLFSPIAERINTAVKAYANENDAVVFDYTSQTSNIITFNDVADITTEIIRRVEAATPKTSAPAASPTAPSARPPATPPAAPDPAKKP